MVNKSFSQAATECGSEEPTKVSPAITNRRDLTQFESVQENLAEQFEYNALVRLVRADSFRESLTLQTSLLDVLQIWSDHFQKLLRIRSAATTDENFSALANQHLQAELGHNEMLAGMRGHRPIETWDPVMEGAASWFADRMGNASDVESTILMHLVIEEAGDLFYRSAAKIFPDTVYFGHHSLHDQDHASMGIQALRNHSNEPEADMIDALNKGWKMMNVLCGRMAVLVYEVASRPRLGAGAETRPGADFPTGTSIAGPQL